MYADEPLMNGKTVVRVDTESLAWEGDEESLESDDCTDDDEEDRVLGDSVEDIDLELQK